jgi:hypothetical protein
MASSNMVLIVNARRDPALNQVDGYGAYLQRLKYVR